MKNPLEKFSYLILRVLSSLIFIMAGLNHLIHTEQAAKKLEQAELRYLATWIAPVEILILLSGIGLILGGILFLVGFKTKISSFVLLLILIPITLTIQVSDAGTNGPLFKNIALMGILIFFMINGAVSYGIDQFFGNKNSNEIILKKI
jgi:putative oxidoreductase